MSVKRRCCSFSMKEVRTSCAPSTTQAPDAKKTDARESRNGPAAPLATHGSVCELCARRPPPAAMWAPDWEHRVDFMLRNGLLVRVEGMAVDDLVAVCI